MASAQVRARPLLRLVAGPATGRSDDHPPPRSDDVRLLAAVRAGDVTAAAMLHDRLRPVVDATIRRLLGLGDPEHQDIAQHVMIEIITSLERYRGDSSLDSWTMTLTANATYNYLRRRRTERRAFSTLRAGAPEEARWTSGTGRATVARSALRRVLACLEELNEAKVWTFMLHDVWGHDLSEVAAITGVSLAAAQTRLVRGRREVRDRLARDPELTSMLEWMGYGA